MGLFVSAPVPPPGGRFFATAACPLARVASRTPMNIARKTDRRLRRRFTTIPPARQAPDQSTTAALRTKVARPRSDRRGDALLAFCGRRPAGGEGGGTAYRIRTDDLRLERAVS